MAKRSYRSSAFLIDSENQILTHIKRPIKLGMMIDARSPFADASVPVPMQTGLEFESTWFGAMVLVAIAPVTTVSAKDVKVVVGSVTVVANVEVKVVRPPEGVDSGGGGGRLEKEADEVGVNEADDADEA